jgi:hypothetical protein
LLGLDGAEGLYVLPGCAGTAMARGPLCIPDLLLYEDGGAFGELFAGPTGAKRL